MEFTELDDCFVGGSIRGKYIVVGCCFPRVIFVDIPLTVP